MAKIIIYGDIDFFPVYLKVNGGKEMTIGGRCPRYISLPAGNHYIEATTMNKLERITQGAGGIGDALLASGNSTISGELYFEENDILLIQLELKGASTKLYNKMVSSATEADKYVEVADAIPVGAKEPRRPGEKNKWLTLLICLFFGAFGIHRFYEKKIFTGILYILADILFVCCITMPSIPAPVFIIPCAIIFLGWPIDFLRILFRKS